MSAGLLAALSRMLVVGGLCDDADIPFFPCFSLALCTCWALRPCCSSTWKCLSASAGVLVYALSMPTALCTGSPSLGALPVRWSGVWWLSRGAMVVFARDSSARGVYGLEVAGVFAYDVEMN